MSVKSQVLELLKSKVWVSCDDFERLFPPKTEGHLSWAQRMRELRTEGFVIHKRPKENCKHTWEYSLIQGQPLFVLPTGQMRFV